METAESRSVAIIKYHENGDFILFEIELLKEGWTNIGLTTKKNCLNKNKTKELTLEAPFCF
jgi:hypothetical protein